MRLQIAALTDLGRARSRNEDAVAANGWLAAGVDRTVLYTTAESTSPCLVAVADGIGGHPDGDIASRLTLSYLLSNTKRLIDAESVAAVVREANLSLYSYAGTNPASGRLGSTVAGLVFAGDRGFAFNVGDSTVARVIDGYIGPLSIEDRRADAGGAGVLTQSLGGLVQITDVDPHLFELTTTPGDRFLLCTDGISDPIDFDAFITATAGRPAEELLELVRQQVLAAGAPDNFSAIVVDVL